MRQLLSEFKACFDSSSKVGQTPFTQHRIIAYDGACTIHQQPCRISKERDAIKAQLKEIIDDGVIRQGPPSVYTNFCNRSYA